MLTLKSWLQAIVIGLLIAVPLGLVIGSSERVYRALRVPLEFCRAISPVALIPIAVLVIGATPLAAVSLAIYGSVWPLLIQTIYGVRSVDPALRDVSHAYGLSRWGVVIHLILPTALPYILTGLAVSSSLALIAIISSEIIIGVHGVGHEINVARGSGAISSAYAYTVWTGILGLLIALAIARVTRRLLRWQPRQEARS
ncbi:MAG: ABC transporter permease [Pigmentiphaga sp.]